MSCLNGIGHNFVFQYGSFLDLGRQDAKVCPNDTDQIRHMVWDATQASQIVTKRCPDNFTGKKIRIYHKCEGRIEKFGPRIAIWHHEACRVMTNGDPEGSRGTDYSILPSHE